MILLSPDRGLVKKKWAVNKADGPLVMYAELIQKKLHHHKLPCAYSHCPELGAVAFHPAKQRPPFTPDFRVFLQIAVKTVNADRRVTGYVVPGNDQTFYVLLDGPHHITPKGVLRKGPSPHDHIPDPDG